MDVRAFRVAYNLTKLVFYGTSIKYLNYSGQGCAIYPGRHDKPVDLWSIVSIAVTLTLHSCKLLQNASLGQYLCKHSWLGLN